MNSKEMTEYLNVLSKLQNCSLEQFVEVNRGNVYNQGTWAHRKVALRVAQKLSPDFAIWVDDRIEELLTTGVTTVSDDDAAILHAMQVLQKRVEDKQRAIEEAEAQIVQLSDTVASMKPKADYYDVVLSCKETVATTQIAQDYGMSAKAFNILLRNFKIQHKVAGQWILYANYLPLGYVHSDSIPITHKDGRKDTRMLSKWTQRGRLFLYEELKKHDVLPLIEKNKEAEA